MKRYRATFTPQRWVRDYAETVEPLGPDTWEVSEGYVEGLLGDNTPNRWTLADVLEPDTYASDEVRYDEAAPDWIDHWDGPFFVTVEVAA